MTTLTTVDVSNGNTADANEVNSNFANVRSVVNGNIDNTNINNSAAIVVSKLSPGSNGQVLGVVGGQASWTAPSSGAGVETGCLLPYAGASPPTGYLLCDGTAVSRSTYSTLFGIIGTAYGVGDGSTTFNLPDMRGRMAFGKGTNTECDALGDSDGETTVGNRRAKHKHSVTNSLTYTRPNEGSPTAGGGSANVNSVTAGVAVGGTLTVGPASSSITDTPGFLVFNFIIKT